ncbi:hypothetical protein [Runella slithyformis]|uniref:Uncharacterized protein n=1 Tax=Runella slithyformis (strain ATCC 29530 / DSM 19594 / LMG 11500 / NCIMB 11436 / LSU 4) TaxID=761193 RepID=A0A7U4E983_RUNSL|nr:hypothetical protein [Runella slithyformis]AEI52153.1 hypothetical protein Runsl_5856 [Runella slithyformis DSM 19594]
MSNNLSSDTKSHNSTVSSGERLQEIHYRLIKSWEKQQHSGLVPMIYPNPQPDSLLFIGINPSLGENDIVKVLAGTEFEQFVPDRASVREYFSFKPDLVHQQLQNWQTIQQYHRQKLNYFERHRKIAEKAGMPWEQLDLFQLRESAQVNLVRLLKNNLTEPFFLEQLEIFFDLLEVIAPKIIVIMNRKTGEILKKKLPEDKAGVSALRPTDRNDVYMFEFRGQRIPVLFSVHVQYKTAIERERINNDIVNTIREFAI